MASKTVYDVLAWGFLAFTMLFALVLLRLWWEDACVHDLTPNFGRPS